MWICSTEHNIGVSCFCKYAYFFLSFLNMPFIQRIAQMWNDLYIKISRSFLLSLPASESLIYTQIL